MYFEKILKIPSLHRCHNCGKRLVNPVVALYSYEGTAVYYCNQECAKDEYQRILAERERDRTLNDYIKGLI